jgi:hypothetical protein
MDDRAAVSIPANPATLAISVIKWQQAIDTISFSGFAWSGGAAQPIRILMWRAVGGATMARGARLIAKVTAWIVFPGGTSDERGP